jgi:hydroxyethylthiazole kinase-like uncharacterized protein yjeF
MDLRLALLNTKQAAQADRASVAEGASLLYLSQNAGAAVAREIVRRWSARPVTVLCGPGGNGGDGFVVARLLAAGGWPVRVASMDARDRLTGSLRKLADRMGGAGRIDRTRIAERAQLVVDATFGVGINRALTEP